MKTEIQFFCQDQTIYGQFYSLSDSSNSLPTLLLLPGFPGNEDDVLGLGEALSLRGLNVLTFNYRGTYQSEGKFSIESSLEDIQAAFDFLRDEATVRKYHIDSNRLMLGGWSYGGGLGLIYAANHPEIGIIFSISGNDFGAIAREYQRNEAFAKMVDSDFESLRYPNGPVRFLSRAPIRTELIPNQERYDLLRLAVKLVDRDIFLIGGWDDYETVLENEILPCYRLLKKSGAENVRIKAFQDGHLFENSRSMLVESIFNWIDTIFGEEQSF